MAATRAAMGGSDRRQPLRRGLAGAGHPARGIRRVDFDPGRGGRGGGERRPRPGGRTDQALARGAENRDRESEQPGRAGSPLPDGLYVQACPVRAAASHGPLPRKERGQRVDVFGLSSAPRDPAEFILEESRSSEPLLPGNVDQLARPAFHHSQGLPAGKARGMADA